MIDHPKPNQYVCLNGIRFDSTIPPGARILFAEFLQWGKEGSFPYEAKQLAKMYSVSTFTTRKWIRILAQHNLIDLHIDMSNGNQKKLIKVTAGS
jgi:hypothetical protein